jgi:hypothetical protein
MKWQRRIEESKLRGIERLKVDKSFLKIFFAEKSNMNKQ